ncbi:putative IS1 encoded protein [Shigella flexneri K-1770]|nr:putative transposase [Shigella flexneri VA-6]EIQ21006.1 putative IS1 encoded protein [Shigella flexneri K-1770]
MPCFTAMRAEIALMSGSAFAVTHHAFSSGAGRTSDGNGSHASTLKSPSYTKSVSWQHYRGSYHLIYQHYLYRGNSGWCYSGSNCTKLGALCCLLGNCDYFCCRIIFNRKG